MLNVEKRVYKLRGLTPTLGGQPASKAIREAYIASKAPTDALREEELSENSYDRDEKGVTVFARNKQDQICFMAHQVLGFFKEAMTATKAQVQLANVKSKISTMLFVEPRFIPIKRDGVILREEDDMLERPLRADTMQGPRSTLQSSEMIEDPWEVEFELTLIPNSGTARSKQLDWDAIETALDYGAYHGISQWRNAGYGKFLWERVDDDAAD